MQRSLVVGGRDGYSATVVSTERRKGVGSRDVGEVGMSRLRVDGPVFEGEKFGIDILAEGRSR